MAFQLCGPARAGAELAPAEASGRIDEAAAPDAAPLIATMPGSAGSLGGIRERLADRGFTFGLHYVGEAFANLRGGLKPGVVYEGLLQVEVDADLDRLLGLPGLALHADFFQIHGRGPSRRLLGNLMTGSGIEALPAVRLHELWLEQTLFGGTLAIRVGQLAGDAEFIVSETAGLFVNGTFGGPASTSANLPAGWIAFPWAAPAVRVKIAPRPDLSVLTAVFNGDPSGGGDGEPLRHNRYGVRFPLHNAPLFMAEVAYGYNRGEGAAGLPGTVKAGFWYHAGRFDDQRYDAGGLSLAGPASTGIARRRSGNHGLYVVVDQALWRMPGTSDQGLAGFMRISAAPGARNPVAFYADGGLVWKGLMPGRPEDTFGVAMAYAKISRRARALDRDARAFGADAPIRSSEALLEVTYQAQVVPGWTIQPDFQYVWRPGGGVVHPSGSGGRIRNAAMLGVRTTVQY